MAHEDFATWELAGLVLSSGLDRPIAGAQFSAPLDLQRVGERLIWSWLGGARQVRSGHGLLDQFVQLVDAPAERILAYAGRWGVLMLCEHHLPLAHNPRPLYAPASGPVTWCLPPRESSGEYWESLEDWRHFTRQARALLNIAARLHDGRIGAAADWGAVYEWRAVQEGPPGQGHLSAERQALTFCVNEWLVLGDVRPQFHWDGERAATPVVTLNGRGLFGALAVQLALAISQTDGLAVCSGCGAPYVPERRPRPNERRYCHSCREAGRAQRDAARDYRSRKAQETPASTRSKRSARAKPKPARRHVGEDARTEAER